MGVEMGEGHKVQSGWLGSQCLTTGRKGMRTGTTGLAQRCLPRAARLHVIPECVLRLDPQEWRAEEEGSLA